MRGSAVAAAVCLVLGCSTTGSGGTDASYEGATDSGPNPWFRDASTCSSTGGSSGTSGGSSGTSGGSSGTSGGTCCNGSSGTSGTSGGSCSNPDPADASTPDATPCDTHTFFYVGSATTVYVTGDFTSWAETPAAGALVMTDASGTWSVTSQIGAGRHIYKLIVDGEWIADPSASEQEPDGFGGVNSVVEVCNDVN